MRLHSLTESYCLSRDLRESSKERLFITTRKFDTWKPGATVKDLRPEIVNAWLAYLLQSGIARRTVRGHRVNLLCIWRDAYPNITPVPPVGIRTVKVPPKPPEAWWPHEVKGLIEEAKKLPGVFRRTKINRAAFWESFLRFSFTTALRLGDTLDMEREWIWPDGSVVIVQHKTAEQHRVQLRPADIEAIDRCMACQPNRRKIWPLWSTREEFYKHFRRLAKAAGLRGTSKWLRRSSATALEVSNPGSAMAHLGHKTPGLAYKHYVDPRMLRFDRPLPPELD